MLFYTIMDKLTLPYLTCLINHYTKQVILNIIKVHFNLYKISYILIFYLFWQYTKKVKVYFHLNTFMFYKCFNHQLIMEILTLEQKLI